MKKSRFSTYALVVLRYLFLVVKGALVGFGAILPGISGGTLCVAFGMYRPILNLLSHPIKTIKEDGFKLLAFIIGGGLGFVGLAGVAAWLLGLNEQVVICIFVGFVLGTVPDLWKAAGAKRRGAPSYISMAVAFVALFCLMGYLRYKTGGGDDELAAEFMKNTQPLLEPNFIGFLVCGVLWGLSFIVPGMSSSTLIIFLGLYEQMNAGISALDRGVLIPLAIGAGGCMLLLSRPINFLFKRYNSIMSHAIIGFMLASTALIVPYGYFNSVPHVIIAIVCIICGAATSFALGVICNKLPQKPE